MLQYFGKLQSSLDVPACILHQLPTWHHKIISSMFESVEALHDVTHWIFQTQFLLNGSLIVQCYKKDTSLFRL